jgi:predicted nucleic-acid-binding protein
VLGLDTNILIRYIVQDDPVQSPLVSRFLKQRCTEASPCYISHIVLCELVWVLESAYGYKREQVAETLKLIFEIRHFCIEEAETGRTYTDIRSILFRMRMPCEEKPCVFNHKVYI